VKVSRRRFIAGASASAALLATGCVQPYGKEGSYLTSFLAPEDQNTVYHWIDVAMQAVRDQAVAPPRAAYNYGYALAAGFLAANGITQTYAEPYGIGAGPANADPEVAYGVAFRAAAAEAFQQPFVFERAKFLKRFADSEAKTLGIEWGKKVGLQVKRMRTNDGAEPSEVNFYLGRYQRRHDVLRWRPTGPFYSARPGPAFGTFDRGLFPGHGAIKPWTLTTGSQFRAPSFPDPASPEFAEEFDNIRRLGGADSTIRTADQSEIALFWEDGAWGATPPGHFIYIAMDVLQRKSLSFIELARAFALIGITQVDASISAWDSKYTHDIVRPETAIRQRAAKFNNPDPRVVRQANWRSYVPTPPFPAYISGHSTFGAAGAEMTALLYGSDEVSFSHALLDPVIWPKLKGVRRSWTSLSQAAEENGLSRLYGGVHWNADHVEAMKAGRAIARQAFEKTFPARA